MSVKIAGLPAARLAHRDVADNSKPTQHADNPDSQLGVELIDQAS
jgi:hypothetical protein